MAYVCVDKRGNEHIFQNYPSRGGTERTKSKASDGFWVDEVIYDEVRCYTSSADDYHIVLPKGTIKKLTGINMSWNDDPINLDTFK